MLFKSELLFTFSLLSAASAALKWQFWLPDYWQRRVESDASSLAEISRLADDQSVFTRSFDKIAVPRVVGSPGHDEVKEFIEDSMKDLQWDTKVHDFSAETPKGLMKFSNIISTPHPRAARYLVISCHYDSKVFDHFEFIGAIDSAVPCSMMIQIAHLLNELKINLNNNEKSLKFVFFDGEESFESWTKKDSLYGSRYLAEKWKSDVFGKGREIDRVDLLVLLDLLGTKNSAIPNFIINQKGQHKKLVNVEREMKTKKLLSGVQKEYFANQNSFNLVDDDHRPFMIKGVPVLHIVPGRFPRVWHTKYDNEDAIDNDVITDLTKLLTAFIVEYLK